MTKKANRDQIRKQNRKIILKALRRQGPVARIELGQITQLSPATVTAITSDLLEQGLIEVLEPDEPKTAQARGRPRSLLRIKPDAVFVLSVRLSVNRIDLSLADFTGEPFLTKRAPFDSSAADADSFPKELVETIRTFVAEASVPAEKIREISIASQGTVDTGAGMVVWSPAFSGRNIPIVEPLSAAFGAECRITNGSNMVAQALHWIDPDRYNGTFAVVMLDHGVGMGLFLDNRLFEGANGMAAEFGHSNHIPGGALCRCGRRGCMEAYLADYALVRAASDLPEGTNPKTIKAGSAELNALINRAEEGEPNALNAFAGAGRTLGFGIARLLAILDPERIILTGTAMRAYPFMKPRMNEGLEDGLVEDLRQNFEIDVIPWDENIIHQGLVAQAIERLDMEYTGTDADLADTSPSQELQADRFAADNRLHLRT